jgi:hypothetical protein
MARIQITKDEVIAILNGCTTQKDALAALRDKGVTVANAKKIIEMFGEGRFTRSQVIDILDESGNATVIAEENTNVEPKPESAHV